MTVYIAEAATSVESSDWVRMTIPCPRCGQVHIITCAVLRLAIDDLVAGRECRCGATLLDGMTDENRPAEQPSAADVEYLRDELQIFKGVAHELGGIVQGVVDALGIRRDAERDVVLAELGRRLLPAAPHQGATTDAGTGTVPTAGLVAIADQLGLPVAPEVRALLGAGDKESNRG
jgi:predicted RNA-binding Zn-ribbon protein involved in translation (DUF1610 family)